MGFDPISLGVGAAVLGSSIYSGYQAQQDQKRGLKSQEQAQAEAKAAGLRQQREADEAEAKMNAKKPSIVSLLEGEQNLGKRGISSTMLTGGVDPASVPVRKPKLGGVSLLGT